VWAIAGKLTKKIIERDLRAVLCAETDQAIAASASAVPAANAHDDVWIEGQPVARHALGCSIWGTKRELPRPRT